MDRILAVDGVAGDEGGSVSAGSLLSLLLLVMTIAAAAPIICRWADKKTPEWTAALDDDAVD
jgi:hypothetical protein